MERNPEEMIEGAPIEILEETFEKIQELQIFFGAIIEGISRGVALLKELPRREPMVLREKLPF